MNVDSPFLSLKITCTNNKTSFSIAQSNPNKKVKKINDYRHSNIVIHRVKIFFREKEKDLKNSYIVDNVSKLPK